MHCCVSETHKTALWEAEVGIGDKTTAKYPYCAIAPRYAGQAISPHVNT